VSAAASWAEANQRALVAELAAVRAALERHAARAGAAALAGAAGTLPGGGDAPAPADGDAAVPALDEVCAAFGLTRFERAVLLLCAGMELDAAFPAACAAAQGDPARAHPTFALALAALEGAHWSAVAPDAPLRRWRLLEVVQPPGTPLVAAILRIDERILHHLAGVGSLDERLAGVVEAVPVGEEAPVPSHAALARRVAEAWRDPAPPLVQLVGPDEEGRRAVAAAACAEAGYRLFAVQAGALPTGAAELEAFARLWEREAALCGGALLIDAGRADGGDPARAAAVERLAERVWGAVMLAARDRARAPRRPVLTLEVDRPATDEQRTLWRQALGGAAPGLNGAVDGLVAQFDLSADAIRAAARDALAGGAEPGGLAERLWELGRTRSRQRLDDLAQRIDPAAGWDDLVLPQAQRQTLREVAAHVRQRARVYHAWGFASKGARGLGISALFSGASGTGKTMAAEVLARDLRLDLFRIDLSAVVSKYIGETEKNLRRVFEAAEESGAVLLFDEADALFGKRSEVKDSHDRYANIEVSYLLQRMETYRGLAILTTNLKTALDTAFLRRIRFVVGFPFPSAEQREEIWRRVFPSGTPLAGVDYARLARLSVAGGNIRNIALHAAFLAADAGGAVTMGHLLQAARGEYAKLEKTLTDAEAGGWS
jgi:hypothetical protein